MGYNPNDFKTNNSRDLNMLHPKVKAKAEEFLAKANEYLNPLGFQVKVISTLRNNAEQNALYAKGRTVPGSRVTNARAGQSVHNFGCAFDIGIFKGNIYNPSEAEKYYTAIAPLGKAIGLEWGGDWISIKDRPHYQYTGKYSNSEFLRKANAGITIDTLLQ